MCFRFIERNPYQIGMDCYFIRIGRYALCSTELIPLHLSPQVPAAH
jgi:hypothetical protein